jgi:hypothetical protein
MRKSPAGSSDKEVYEPTHNYTALICGQRFQGSVRIPMEFTPENFGVPAVFTEVHKQTGISIDSMEKDHIFEWSTVLP